MLLVFAAACYSPSVPTGAPCDKDHGCPRPLICAAATSTCERTEVDASLLDSEQPIDAFVPPIDSPPIQGCTPMGFDTCGDGIDQDCDGADEVCAANDLAPDAIDVTMGGTLSGDLNLACDNAPEAGCGNAGGRDLFYKVTLTEPQVYYFDTFGSNFDTTVRVFPGKACTAIAATDMPSCSDHACGGGQSQLALELPAGTSCVVVDQNSAVAQGAMMLKVTAAGHVGERLLPGPRTLSGDTCTSADTWKAQCGAVGGKEDAYFFTVCPGATAHVDASTCVDVNATHFDTVLFVRKAPAGMGSTLACSDDAPTCAARPDRPDHPDGSILDNVAAAGPGVFFLVVDGYDSCGTYVMDARLQ